MPPNGPGLERLGKGGGLHKLPTCQKAAIRKNTVFGDRLLPPKCAVELAHKKRFGVSSGIDGASRQRGETVNAFGHQGSAAERRTGRLSCARRQVCRCWQRGRKMINYRL